MEGPAAPVEEVNSRVVSLTDLPVYEVQEVWVERRLFPGKHRVIRDGVQVEVERRKTA